MCIGAGESAAEEEALIEECRSNLRKAYNLYKYGSYEAIGDLNLDEDMIKGEFLDWVGKEIEEGFLDEVK